MMESFIGTLYPIPPYHFELSVRSSRYYSVIGQMDNESYLRVVRLRTGLALARVISQGLINTPALAVYLVASTGPVDVNELLRRVGAIMNIGSDLRQFYAYVRTDPILWQIIRPLHGLHMLQTETIYEGLSMTIIAQQIALTAAQRAERWLVNWAGESLTYNDEQHFVFPRAERIAAATVEDLTPTKITFRRMSVLIDIAQREEKQSLERFRRQSLDTAYDTLVSIKGVGHWTAAWTITRALSYYMYCGSADVALRSAVNHYFLGQDGRCSAEETDAIFQRYDDYAGVMSFYTLLRWAHEKY